MDNLYSKRLMQTSVLYKDKKCPICKKYLEENQDIYLIIFSTQMRNEYKELFHNQFVHKDELDEIEKLYGENTEETILNIRKLFKKRSPKIEITEEEQKRIDAFENSCFFKGFKRKIVSGNIIKCKQNGSSLCTTYNYKTGIIKVDHSGKHGLLDHFFLKELESQIANKMNEILGLETREEYSAAKEISGIVADVNKIIGK